MFVLPLLPEEWASERGKESESWSHLHTALYEYCAYTHTWNWYVYAEQINTTHWHDRIHNTGRKKNYIDIWIVEDYGMFGGNSIFSILLLCGFFFLLCFPTHTHAHTHTFKQMYVNYVNCNGFDEFWSPLLFGTEKKGSAHRARAYCQWQLT